MAVETLASAPSPDAYNQLSKMLAAMRAAGVQGELLDSATVTMNTICDRYERVGKIGLKDDEVQALRGAIAAIEAAMAQLPLDVFAAAVAKIEVYCAMVGA